MAALDVTHLAGRRATELSGGELARVLIARLLAQRTPLILADEPVAGLDPSHQFAVMELFARLAQQGRTVIASIHDLTLAARPGLTLALEPWFTLGSERIKFDADGWTIRSFDGSRGAHSEHTIAVTDGEALVLTSHGGG